jgi:hypothetical protein
LVKEKEEDTDQSIANLADIKIADELAAGFSILFNNSEKFLEDDMVRIEKPMEMFY